MLTSVSHVDFCSLHKNQLNEHLSNSVAAMSAGKTHLLHGCGILMYLNLVQLTSQIAQSTPVSSAALTLT